MTEILLVLIVTCGMVWFAAWVVGKGMAEIDRAIMEAFDDEEG